MPYLMHSGAPVDRAGVRPAVVGQAGHGDARRRPAGPARHRRRVRPPSARRGQAPRRQGRTDRDGDHYDPETRTVRLLPDHHDGRSVAAIAVAAHEVSHAIQHARGEPAFARGSNWCGNCLGRAAGDGNSDPRSGVVRPGEIACAGGVAGPGRYRALGIRVVVHAVTLPVEFDASFAKALPVLEGSRYLSEPDLPAARSVLRAAALTYVAAALATLLNVARWADSGF